MQIRQSAGLSKNPKPQKLPVLDTKIIIRFLTSDIKLQAEKVEELLNKSEEGSLVMPNLIVAATALQMDAVLATRNISDFARIPNLRFFDPKTHPKFR